MSEDGAGGDGVASPAKKRTGALAEATRPQLIQVHRRFPLAYQQAFRVPFPVVDETDPKEQGNGAEAAGGAAGASGCGG